MDFSTINAFRRVVAYQCQTWRPNWVFMLTHDNDDT